jgi:hypothetical protein
MRNKHLRINPIHVINEAINAVGPARCVLCMLVEDVSLPAPTYFLGISYFVFSLLAELDCIELTSPSLRQK